MRLSIVLTYYLHWRLYDDMIAIANVSRDAARRLGNRQGEGEALNNLGDGLRGSRRFQEAITAQQDAPPSSQGHRRVRGVTSGWCCCISRSCCTVRRW